ncbi:protein translocase subunit SecF [Naumannella huperziae]
MATKQTDPTDDTSGEPMEAAERTTGPDRGGSALGRLAHRWWTGNLAFEFIRVRKRWYAASAVVILICLIGLLVRGLSLGIEFTGGAAFTAPAPDAAAAVPVVREAVQNSGVPDMQEVTVQVTGASVRTQTRALTPEETTTVRTAIADSLQIPPDQVANSVIGPSWGQQVSSKAALALGIFLALVMIMIAIYFRDWKYSAAAIVALMHDLILTVGVYALLGFTVTPTTVIGVLTILGYSLYDTVVVFDRLRENTRELSRKTYAEEANDAVNQVLIRSLNTTMIGILPVVALLFTGAVLLGTGPLKDVGLALLVGMLAGAYSSIFIATPLVVDFKRRDEDVVRQDKRVHKRRDEAELKARNASSAKVSITETADEEGTPDGSVLTMPRTKVDDLRRGAAGRPQPSRKTRSERKSR